MAARVPYQELWSGHQVSHEFAVSKLQLKSHGKATRQAKGKTLPRMRNKNAQLYTPDETVGQSMQNGVKHLNLVKCDMGHEETCLEGTADTTPFKNHNIHLGYFRGIRFLLQWSHRVSFVKNRWRLPATPATPATGI